MAKQKEKETALRIRSKGTSISEIAKRVGVSKSTVSYWCRDIKLSSAALKRIIKNSNKRSAAGILAYTESLRLLRQQRTKEDVVRGQTKVGTLSKRDLFCIGLGLYWGEGYRHGSQEFGFTNSDPAIIKVYTQWLKLTFNITPQDLILRVSINAHHKYRIDEVESFWSQLLRVPRSQFTKISLIKTENKKQYSNKSLHFGTLRIKVRCGTRMRREVLGAIEHVSNSNILIW